MTLIQAAMMAGGLLFIGCVCCIACIVLSPYPVRLETVEEHNKRLEVNRVTQRLQEGKL